MRRTWWSNPANCWREGTRTRGSRDGKTRIFQSPGHSRSGCRPRPGNGPGNGPGGGAWGWWSGRSGTGGPYTAPNQSNRLRPRAGARSALDPPQTRTGGPDRGGRESRPGRGFQQPGKQIDNAPLERKSASAAPGGAGGHRSDRSSGDHRRPPNHRRFRERRHQPFRPVPGTVPGQPPPSPAVVSPVPQGACRRTRRRRKTSPPPG